AALVLRVWQLGAFITGDELAWTFRAARLWQSLAEGRLATAHGRPGGTVTLVTAAVGLLLRRLIEGAHPVSPWQDLAGLSALNPQDAAHLRLIAAFWPTCALAVALLNVLVVVLLAFLVARLWGARAGLFAGLLLSASPHYLALSRILAPDALTSGLALGAVLALLWALKKPARWGAFLLSGALAGLAVLNQSAAAILVPYGLILVGGVHLAGRRPALLWVRNTVLWCVALAAAGVLACPMTWSTPLEAMRALGIHAWRGLLSAGQGPHLPDLAAVAVRLTPLVMVGLALAVARITLDGNRRRLPLLGVVAYAVLCLVLGPRAAAEPLPELTAILALVVAAAVGLDGLVSAAMGLAKRRGRRAMAFGLGLALTVVALAAIGWQAGKVIALRPYYALYRNPWLRMPLSVGPGRGEGMDQLAAYLNAQPGAEELIVATDSFELLAPLFAGQTVPLDANTLATADYVAIYGPDLLDPLLARLPQEPQHVVVLGGTEYARVYANRLHEPILELLSGTLQADDVVVLDSASPFGRHYAGPAPWKEIRVESEEQVAGELGALVAGRWRLWHVAFDGADPRGLVRTLLESHAVLLQRWQLTGATVSTYLLPLDVHFHPLVADNEVNLEFAGRLRLERAGLAESQVQYRQPIVLVLQWRTGEEPTGDFGFSLRLVDSDGRLWAQEDRLLTAVDGRPASAWPPKSEVRSERRLSLPPGAPPGTYSLRAVLYTDEGHLPLIPVGAAGPHTSEVMDLAAVQVLPAQVPPTRSELSIPHPLGVELVRGVELLGCEIGSEAVTPGLYLPLRLWWHCTDPMTVTYQAHLMLLDAHGDLRSDRFVELAGSQHPTSNWIQGEVLEGRYGLPVDVEAAAGEAILGVQLVSPRGAAGEPVRLGTVQIAAVEHVFQVPPMQQTRKETLGQMVRLLGYDVEAESLRPGQSLRLTLYWQCLAPMDRSYTVFTHLLKPGSDMCCGHDSIPVGGTRPTPGWVLHEVLTDVHEIYVPADAPPGPYTVEVGMYDASTGARLPAFDGSGAHLAHDRILLGTVEVAEGGG
ncbi:MAG: glycosyltransferase family 39 protein, partial [Anaerolineae bacterium]|nr:glycosyltransferase family 39 protein [Anaerolineae bacterium]